MKCTFLSRKWGLILIACFLYAFLLVLNILSPLAADDYSYMYQFATGERIQNVLDIFPSMAVHYRTVNGRIVVHGIVQFFICTGKIVFNLINPLVYVALGYGICRLITGKNLFSPGLFLLVNIGLWFLIPVFGHTVLFMTGAINYLWPATALVYFLYPYRKFLKESTASSPIRTAMMLPLGFVMGLLHETASGATLLAILLFSCILLWKKSKLPLWWVLGALGCAIGLCILVLAPGNGVRLSAYYGMAHTGGILGNFFSLLLVYTGHFLMRCAILLIPLLLILLFGHIDSISKDAVGSAIVLFLSALAANYVVILSGGYPSRAQFTYTILLFLSFGTFYCGLDCHLRPYSATAVLSLLTACTLGHMCYILNDVGAVYFAHRQQVQEIQSAIAQGERDLLVTAIDPRSPYISLHIGHLSSDPNHWINIELAMHYGIDSIRTTEIPSN